MMSIERFSTTITSLEVSPKSHLYYLKGARKIPCIKIQYLEDINAVVLICNENTGEYNTMLSVGDIIDFLNQYNKEVDLDVQLENIQPLSSIVFDEEKRLCLM